MALYVGLALVNLILVLGTQSTYRNRQSMPSILQENFGLGISAGVSSSRECSPSNLPIRDPYAR